MTMRPFFRLATLLAAVALAACGGNRPDVTPGTSEKPKDIRVTPADPHAAHTLPAPSPAAAAAAAGGQGTAGMPAGNAEAPARLAASPRHGEWAMIPANGIGGADSIRAWVVYPERREKAPVVLVVHEIFGLTPWIRGVADQLAADGFIAIAPDLLSGKRPVGYLDAQPQDSAVAVIRTLVPGDVARHLDLVAEYGRRLPSANGKLGITGFCWGGSWVMNYAAHAGSRLDAGVLYYGSAPADSQLLKIRAPILGLYGGDDARVNATIPRADSTLKQAGRSFAYQLYDGAGHGFLRQQDGRNGANMAASRDAWPRTVAFFREHLR